MSRFARSALCLLAAGLPVLAQFPPKPEGVKVLESKFGDGAKITYKEPGLCETTPGVKSYAGYVHLPPGTLEGLDDDQDYPINTFFWFFEARKDPENAPLSIWINGGPGSSSMMGLLVENGPCIINPDSNSTTLNQYSWNNEVNMLFLDQPTQVGLSYDTLANYTKNLITGQLTKLTADDPIPEQNATFLVGTYPSNESKNTALGSRNAAIALWHFAQVWFQEFPGYHPGDSRISLATESYGGRYGPAFFSFFEEQNQKIENGTWKDDDGDMKILNLDTLMIINGCLDRQVQWPSYPEFAFKNTYGIETVNETIYDYMVDSLVKPGGCRDMVNDCRAVSAISDPENTGINATVNDICSKAENYCSSEVRGPYLDYSGRNYYDISQVEPVPFPTPFYKGWLNQEHVQAALGVPLNWTQSNSAVSKAFRSIGDYPRPGWVEDLAFLLENNIKVSLIYGDRDFACNWMGGEAVSLAIDYVDSDNFKAAGYADIRVNGTFNVGQVRQYGNLSYARVHQAGHEVPSYQPEGSLLIFNRALFNKDIATGEIDTAAPLPNSDGKFYSSSGPSDTFAFTQEPPPQYPRFCYVLDPGVCTEEQIESILKGTAVLKHWLLVDQNTTRLFPEVVGDGGSPTSPPSPTDTSSASGLFANGIGQQVGLLVFLSVVVSVMMF
ncbi:carboxypeptidase S1 like B [[Emmonsia] crescens]|uniref:Carboxypeptidase S1 like B n=1 Tax=[Emmonsia] crescens TaxID=73230 RepID=A0A0G2J7Q4_9EURO|nr:carboxypeptidase S1 like B [Emmonsia crescens UAMH 3008]